MWDDELTKENDKTYTIRGGVLRELLAAQMERDYLKLGEIRVIPLIKVAREVLGLGLKEAKDYVEEVGKHFGWMHSREVDCAECKGRGYHEVFEWSKKSPLKF